MKYCTNCKQIIAGRVDPRSLELPNCCPRCKKPSLVDIPKTDDIILDLLIQIVGTLKELQNGLTNLPRIH